MGIFWCTLYLSREILCYRYSSYMNFSELLITHLSWRKIKNGKVIWCGKNTGKYTNVLRHLGMSLCVLSGVYCLLNTTVISNSCQYRQKCSLTSLSIYCSIKKKNFESLMEKKITFSKTLFVITAIIIDHLWEHILTFELPCA